ncbi:sigma-70 family RNA polymerase sigma factor [Cytobacillus sp. NCCP-133]|uniref:sigma-70 family RNA polymerase sigma factor n=1 Tax=Cytobacillus sp. NCCP-133 TaxID=766848 RepID=UPI0022303B7B|nr:sigma-70 family RNA polymerase sigma factor [Cytobacillus sp. NCCP-133]GLB60302.1 hypothetical protein NCCP133_24340 [Cytobacillus sp. NCCP-133]
MESFEQTAAQYEPMIHQIIRSLNIYKNKEEFFQLGLIKLWECWNQFDPEKGNFLTYAYTNVRLRIMGELNKSKRHEDRNVVPDEEYWHSAECSSLDRPLEEKIILSYCEGLSKNQTIWVVSTFLYDLTTNQMAEKYGVTNSAVKEWKRGALTRLKSTIKER